MSKNKFTEEEYQEAAKLWKTLNPNEKSIPFKTKIRISNGKEVTIGSRMYNMRANPEKLTKNQQEFWKDYGLFEENLSNKDKYKEEEYEEAAIIWKKENPELDFIPTNTKIRISNGKEIPVGKKLIRMRQNTNVLTAKQINFWKNYGLLATNQSNKDKYTEEEYQEAAKLWREDYPYLEMIPHKATITIPSGKEIPIGTRMSYIRTHLDSLTQDEKQFWMEYGLFAEGKNKSLFKETPLEEYRQLYKSDKEKEKRVIKLVRDIRKKRRLKRIQNWTIEKISKELNIDIDTLLKYFCKISKKKVPENIEKESYQGKKLNIFCFEHNYDYKMISSVLRLYELGINDTIEGLVNRQIVEHEKPKNSATWIFEKYGMLIEEIVKKLGIDNKNVLNKMTLYQLRLEDAIGKEIFERGQNGYQHLWLQEVYEYLIEEIDISKNEDEITLQTKKILDDLKNEFEMTNEEVDILQKLFFQYVNIMKEYQIIDVGLETNEQMRIEKIKKHHLEPESIEESFFIPLEFDKNKLLGRKKELYMRRQLLRQYIIDWDYYTDLEKEQIIIQNKFTNEEIAKIEKTRQDINEVIMKAKK